MTAETQARPDTSALPWETQVRLLVAEARGAEWERSNNGAVAGWIVGDAMLAFGLDGREMVISERLPNPLTDPAAWGALVESERITVSPPERTPADAVAADEYDTDWCAWVEGKPGARAATIGEAVTLAFLASRGIPMPTRTPEGA